MVKEPAKVTVEEAHDVWAFIEINHGKIAPVSLELLSKAREQGNALGRRVEAVIIGNDVNQYNDYLLGCGADVVHVCDHPDLENYIYDKYAAIFMEIIEKYKPEIILLGATHIGRDLAPRLAQRLQTGLTANCTKVDLTDESCKYGPNLLEMTRPALGGNVLATILCPYYRPQLATVRPGILKVEECQAEHDNRVIEIEYSEEKFPTHLKLVKVIDNVVKHVNLEQAKVIVAGGRGMGSKKSFQLLFELADLIGGEVGASRGAVFDGYTDDTRQIGQTGKTVAPDVYIACGISGSLQHMAAIGNSKLIISINKDPNAPITKYADYNIVGTIETIIPELIKQIRVLKGLE
ncbi:MAG TPA: electron transfer flavoprotein subunit alpha/FixB family protein [Candidatus Lokiarchaeia archaeon]|nr:electron transfer flavoprotein subunit alpha/FixB family protein [Candidatus Lokiarchaeia archaeon]